MAQGSHSCISCPPPGECPSALLTGTPGTSWTWLRGVVIASPVLVSFTEDWVRQRLLGVSTGVDRLATPRRVNHTTTQSPLATPVCNSCPTFLQQMAGFVPVLFFLPFCRMRLSLQLHHRRRGCCPAWVSRRDNLCFQGREKLLLKPSPSCPRGECPAPSTHATTGAVQRLAGPALQAGSSLPWQRTPNY